MRLLILGSFDFASPIKNLGHDVFTCGPDSDADLCLPDIDPDWSVIHKTAQRRGLFFDAVLVCDNVGQRRLPTGMTACPAVTAFYGIDAPLNEFWQKPYAQLFDVAFFDQPAQAKALADVHDNAYWLPLGVDPFLYDGPPPESLRRGVAFVGVVNPAVRPKRSAILDRVGRFAPLEIRGGRKGQWFSIKDAACLYRQYQVVLNENLFPGFTTRPLEVMASGGCLLSEGPTAPMTRHFKEFEHLLYFNPDNLDQRLELAMSDSTLRARMAQNGRQAVLEGHTLGHRAADIIEHLEWTMGRPRQRPDEALAMRFEGEALMWAALRWPAKDGKRRLLRASGRLKMATKTGATPATQLLSITAISQIALGHYDQAIALLLQAAEQGGQMQSLQLAITAATMGRNEIFHQMVGQWHNGLSALSKGPGRAAFHLAAAKLLLNEGIDLTPGFNRRTLPIEAWHAFEHLVEAARLEPNMGQAWELAGDILQDKGAPNEAHVMFTRAWALEASKKLSDKLAKAAREGYLC